MRLGYNTNGFAHHNLVQAIDFLAEVGFRSVAITLDHGALNPYANDLAAEIEAVRNALSTNTMNVVVETGARYLLDPRRKHEPTLVSADSALRAVRVDFLKKAIDIAKKLNATCVSLWSGVVHDGASDDEAFQRLVESLERVIDYAAENKIAIGFEPEPGMLVDTVDRFAELRQRLDSRGIDRTLLGLTLDVGHLHCQGEGPIDDVIRRWGADIVNVHIEDMRRGVHEHLMFGAGEMDFPQIIRALHDIEYRGPINVELSRHSHMAPEAARHAYEFLAPLLKDC